MKRIELQTKITKKAGIPLQDSSLFFEMFLNKIRSVLNVGDYIKIAGLGSFHYKKLVISSFDNETEIIGFEQFDGSLLLFNLPTTPNQKFNPLDNYFKLTNITEGSKEVPENVEKLYQSQLDIMFEDAKIVRHTIVGNEYLIMNEKDIQGQFTEEYDEATDLVDEEVEKTEDVIEPSTPEKEKSVFDLDFNDFELVTPIKSGKKDLLDEDFQEELELPEDEDKVNIFEDLIDDVTAEEKPDFNFFEQEETEEQESDFVFSSDDETKNFSFLEEEPEELPISKKPFLDSIEEEPVIEEEEIKEEDVDWDDLKDVPEISEEPLIEEESNLYKDDQPVDEYQPSAPPSEERIEQEEEFQKRKSNALFILVAGILVISAVGLFAYYKMGFRLFSSETPEQNTEPTNKIERTYDVPVTVEGDPAIKESLPETTTTKDTVAETPVKQNTVPVPTATGNISFEKVDSYIYKSGNDFWVQATSAKSMKLAERQAKHFGDREIVYDSILNKRWITVFIGRFKSVDEARKVRNQYDIGNEDPFY